MIRVCFTHVLCLVRSEIATHVVMWDTEWDSNATENHLEPLHLDPEANQKGKSQRS